MIVKNMFINLAVVICCCLINVVVSLQWTKPLLSSSDIHRIKSISLKRTSSLHMMSTVDKPLLSGKVLIVQNKGGMLHTWWIVNICRVNTYIYNCNQYKSRHDD